MLGKNCVQEDRYKQKDKKKACTNKSAIQHIYFIHEIKHAFDYLFNIKIHWLTKK